MTRRRRVFEIGMAYLQERVPCSLLGMISYSCPEYGIEILDGLIAENPNLAYADDAQIEAARYYFERGEYAEAEHLYQPVAQNEQSRWRDLAEYQAALSVYLQIRGVDYDQHLVRKAERRFSNYLEHHPRGFGVWLHHFRLPGVEIGFHLRDQTWVSAMAQGEGVSLLLRAHRHTPNPAVLDAADLAVKAYEFSLEEHGVCHRDGAGGMWFEEFPCDPPTHVLNGFIT